MNLEIKTLHFIQVALCISLNISINTDVIERHSAVRILYLFNHIMCSVGTICVYFIRTVYQLL